MKPDTPAVVLARIRAGKEAGRQRLQRTGMFRDAVNMRLPRLVPVETGSELVPQEQVDIHLFKRGHDWYMAKGYDEDPELRSTRAAEDDDLFAEMDEVLMTSVLAEAKAAGAARDASGDTLWHGIGFVWAGTPMAWDRKAVYESSQGTGDVVDQILGSTYVPGTPPTAPQPIYAQSGDAVYTNGATPGTPGTPGRLVYKPGAGHDHKTIAHGLDMLAESQIQAPTLPTEQFQAVVDARIAHIKAEDREAKKPVAGPQWEYDKAKLVWEYAPPGWTVWDARVYDYERSHWVARLVVLDPDFAKEHPGFKPELAARLSPQPIPSFDPRQPEFGRGALGSDLDTETRAKENGGVCVWEYYNAWTKKRHYVSEQITDSFLEKDDTYPYLDDDDQPAVPGFFPCEPWWVTKPAGDDPMRAHCHPVLEGGWPQQLEAVRLRSAMLSGAKRSKRAWLAHNAIPDVELQSLADGRDGVVVKVPAEVANQGLQNAMIALPMPPVPIDWTREFAMVLEDFNRNVGITQSQMSGQGQDVTATEAENVQATADITAAYIIKRWARSYANLAEKSRAIVQCAYPPEKLAELIGAKYEAHFENWKARGSEGRRLYALLSSQAGNPVRVNQLMQALQIAQTAVDPVFGTPIVKSIDQLVKDIYRALDQAPPDMFTTEERMAMMAAVQAPAPGEEQGGDGPNGASPKPQSPPRPGSRQAPQRAGGMAGDASRVGPSRR